MKTDLTQRRKDAKRKGIACVVQCPTPNAQRLFTLICGLSLMCSRGIAQTAGVPLGGIGAGSVRLEADGRFRGVSILEGKRSVGEDLPGCFLALWTGTPSRTTAEVLTSTSTFGLPVSAMPPVFSASYPFATLTYLDPARPVSVTISAFSPFLPYDLRNSSFPGFIVQFFLKNETNEPVEVSAALSMENLTGNSRTDSGGTYAAVAAAEGNFGGRFSGSGSGEMTVQVQPPRGDALVTQAGWNATAAATQPPAWWTIFAKEGRVEEATPLNSQRPTPNASSAVLAVRLTLKPKERLEIPFAVSWSPLHKETPKPADPKKPETDPKANLTPAQIFPDSLLSSRELLNQRLSLVALTGEWQGRLRTSSLPVWLQTALMNSLTPLTTNLRRVADTPSVIVTDGDQPVTTTQSQSALLALNDLFPVLLAAPLDTQTMKRESLSEPLALLEKEQPDAALTLLETLEKNRKSEDISQERLATWQILPALWGFEHQKDEITLTPRLPGTWRSLRTPIFAFGFWAYGEFVPRARGYSLSFRLDRTFAVPVFDTLSGKRDLPTAAPDLTVASLVLPAPPTFGTASPTVYARLRQAALGVRLTVLPDHKIRVTFDTPLHLAVGDRIDLEAK